MFFQKNLPLWERALRLCLGLLIVGASFYFPLTGIVKWVQWAAACCSPAPAFSASVPCAPWSVVNS